MSAYFRTYAQSRRDILACLDDNHRNAFSQRLDVSLMAGHGTGCTVCKHRERERIEALRASGVSLEALAKKFKVGRDSIWRHWRDHVSAELRAHYLAGPATIEELRERAAKENLSVLDYLGIARSMLVGQMTSSSEVGDAYRVALLSSRLVEVLREIGKITGEVERIGGGGVTINNTVAIMSDPRMVELQTGLVRIAREHPAARTDIVALLRGLDAKPETPRTPLIECQAADDAA